MQEEQARARVLLHQLLSRGSRLSNFIAGIAWASPGVVQHQTDICMGSKLADVRENIASSMSGAVLLSVYV